MSDAPMSGAPMPVPAPLPTGIPVLPHGPAWLRSPVGLGRATAALLGLVVATDLFAIWADRTMYDVASALVDGRTGEGIRRKADHADSLYSAAGYAQTGALLATIVVFLVWFHRARVNAEVFDPFGHSKSRGWAIGGWFVPILNLWRPRRVMLDIWDASIRQGSRTTHGLVNVWWALWLASLVAYRDSTAEHRDARTALEIQHAAGRATFADAADIAAALLAILVVLRLTRMQHEKALRGPAGTAL
ncbi:DUF4328 domain-containing protein [Streptomyces sp. RPA4-2]|uniref:DUF4328 domain-containing protein n=2 Tax=unclassified Streptomyces TaxID=2593676 RepID=UPI00143E2DF8|nr:DUF4328 domain-containing protein [Streptomyces sp. RPA4-2]QIY64237.1 DUF4328 domain-containing protein [Streptomyces sp. RPA4-2]